MYDIIYIERRKGKLHKECGQIRTYSTYIYAPLPSVDAVRALYGASIVQTERDKTI